MPFFSKDITDLTTDDLAELLTDNVVESVRLEFKSQPPGPDDTLKKLSGFANTFGGYLIVGASASSDDGRLRAYPGVNPQSNYRQTIIQRCYEGVWPPIEVFVSGDIPAPNDANKVCYVIYVSESWEAPHFLTKRKGAWIRTDEFSQRFETRLATFEEIQHLANRRRLAVERYEHLYNRAISRFESMIVHEYSNHRKALSSVGATLSLSLCPQFPTRPLIADRQLLEITRSEETISSRDVAFPFRNKLITQQESVLVLRPTSGLSILEVNVWGQLMYSSQIEYSLKRDEQQISCIRLGTFLDCILVFLRYACAIYHKIGYNGPLLLRMLLKQIQGKPFLSHPVEDLEFSPISQIDNEISLDLSSSTTRLNEQEGEIASDLLKAFFFSIDRPDQNTDSSTITSLLRASW